MEKIHMAGPWITELEIHTIAVSCARARRQMLSAMPVKKPVLH